MMFSALQNLHFAEPYWLFLLLVIPILIWIRSKRGPNSPAIRFSSLSKIESIKHAGRKRFLWILKFFRYSCLFFLVLSIARPQLDQSTETIESSGVDIVLAVDLSASMLALDMSDSEIGEVTRLDVVKGVLQDFIKKRIYDRIGVVAFSVNPYLVSALTLDKEHLQKNLARLRVGLTHQTGTNIGSALAEGINRLRPLESKSKILILLTDGKDEPAPQHSPLVFAEGALQDEIKIYTIAIGTNSRTKTYLFDPSTKDLMRYTNGRPVVQVADYPVDKEILKKISSKTEARYFEAKDRESLRLIYDEIDRLEKTDVKIHVNALFDDLFQWPLVLAILFLLMEFVLAKTLLMKIP
ncbi:MAG: VWA domain-containing protein [Opitutales bacterium]|nr:VWA domain-containing protein [Opitutales bacterium]